MQNNQCHKYIIYDMNNVLQKTKSNTLEDTVAKWHHNSTCNWPGAITPLELRIEESQIFFSFWEAGGQGWVHLWLVPSKYRKQWYAWYNIKGKAIIRLNAEKHLRLTLKLWASYLLSENWRLNYPISQLSKICPRRVISNKRHSPTEDKCCCPTEDKDYCPIEDKEYCPISW
jgi:hypothetical protein